MVAGVKTRVVRDVDVVPDPPFLVEQPPYESPREYHRVAARGLRVLVRGTSSRNAGLSMDFHAG